MTNKNALRKRREAKRAEKEDVSIAAGIEDPVALDAVCREWLVPRLIAKFLRDRNIELHHNANRK
ncbi:MAG: hypothetical protein JWO13_396 [Acidobacteriales bacterium]|nr:hypothetical protein [Terriglobales bacterium]